MNDNSQLTKMANAVRMLSAEMIEKAKSGHPGMPLGMADIATVLWTRFLRFDAQNPNWPDRDRFILSNGHGSALLYSLMYLAGFRDMSLEELKNFRQWGSKTAGHPEKTLADGIDFSTGPLGQGLAGGVGMALAERILNASFTDELVNHKTYVFVGDGCLMEGISEEAIELAGHLRLNHLIVLWDDNHITIDGTTSITSSTDMKKRFEASQWLVLSCDGHDFDSITTALTQAQTAEKPVLIACHTTIGYGAPTKAGTPKSHGSPLGADELAGLRRALNWTNPPFKVDESTLSAWRAVGIKGADACKNWEERLNRSSQKEAFLARLNQELPTDFKEKLKAYKEKLVAEKQTIATRKSSENTLNFLTAELPFLIGGAADLAGASYTKTATAKPVSATDYHGDYIHYGIREHAMGGIMNGLSAHGGFLPFAGTFLSFVDYMKPAVRLACLMELPIWYVLTHDSIGVGEDGPTHQPIEQLVSLRATPNLLVFRPCDSVEMIESYECALQNQTGPSALICSRQALPLLRSDITENKTIHGGYVLREAVDKKRDITLIATGSEVALAVAVAEKLAENQIQATVVSMPCRELFERQPLAYQEATLGSAPRLIMEAGSTMGWDRFVGESGAILGIDHFGASAPGDTLFQQYGFTVENVERIVYELLEANA